MRTHRRDGHMVLEAFRVRMYRSIVDSGAVPVSPLTALVGRPQSGKSSLLHALAALHPRACEVPTQRDWPRGRRMANADEQLFCVAAFALSPPAGAALAELLGRDAPCARTLLGRAYDGRFALAPVEQGESAERELDVARGSLDQDGARAFFARWLPAFVHLDRESLLDVESAALALAAPRERWEPRNRPEVALLSLLEAAGLEHGELLEGPSEERMDVATRELRAALARSGRAHDVDLAFERGRLVAYLGAAGGGRVRVDRAPEGERWCFTLDAMLAAPSVAHGPGAVLLLDGPGRSLRDGGASTRSASVKDVLSSYLATCRPIVYTARLPFRMDLQHDEQVLVLAATPKGHVVGRELAGAGPADLAVRAALGMTGRSSFAIAEVNLVVEGPNDADLVLALADLLARSGEPALPAGVNVARAGGAHEVASVAAFLARQGLGAIALLDTDEAGRAAREALRRMADGDARVERVVALSLAEAAGLERDEAAIEDLFPPRWYLDVVREVCARDVPDDVLRSLRAPRSGKIAAHVKKVLTSHGAFFKKSDVAEALRARVAALRSVDELPRATAGAARTLVGSIRAAADALAAWETSEAT